MSTLNQTRVRKSDKIVTHEGGEGRKAQAKEELAIATLSSFLGDSFYEKASTTLDRIKSLSAQVPAEYLTQLARVARQEFDMRSTPAALMGFYTLLHGQPRDHRVVEDVFFRGDELGDYLGAISAYSDSGKVIPSAVRFARTVLQSNLSERKALRYSASNRSWNLAKIIRLSHARAGADPYHKALFDFVLKWKSEGSLLAAWNALSEEERALLPLVGKAVNGEDEGSVSWERSRSAGASWESVVPSMGYMALIRNLNNFFENIPADKAEVWKGIADRIADREQVEKSRQLPFRFLSARRAIGGHSHHRKYSLISNALSDALDHSVGNLPRLEGRTLIVVDTSGSMDSTVSDMSNVSYVDIGTLFGASLFQSQDADVVCFGTSAKRVLLNKNHSVFDNQSLLRNDDLRRRLGYGTNLSTAFSQVNVSEYDNIVVFSDMQIHDLIGQALRGYKGNVFSINLAAYEAQMSRVGVNFYAIGGWSDKTLRLISMLSTGSLVKYIQEY